MRIFILLFMLAPLFLRGQYPDNPRKLRLGFQTTGAGLTYIKDGAPAHTPGDDEDAWMVLDTANNVLYYWDETAGAWENILDDITQDTVFQITNVPDTTTLAPMQGDAFINSTADTLGLYNGAGWVLFFGGGSIEVADGLTILGDGTGGDPFRVDTTLLATRTYADSLFSVADSLREAGDRSTPILIQAFDRIIQLDGCSTSETVITGFQLIDDTAIDEGAITFEIGSPQSITYDVYNADSTSYYFETSVSRAAGIYTWEVGYTDPDGNFVGDTNLFEVMAGTPDTVTVWLNDSISVTRRCGVEISRDTIASGGTGGGSLWLQSGSEIYYDSGNVGIGAAPTSARLHINDSATDNVTTIKASKAFTNTAVGNQSATDMSATFNPASTSSTEFLAHKFALTSSGSSEKQGATRALVVNNTVSGSGDAAKVVGTQSDVAFFDSADSPESLGFLSNTSVVGTGHVTLSDGIKVTLQGDIGMARGLVVSMLESTVNSETPDSSYAIYIPNVEGNVRDYAIYTEDESDEIYLAGSTGIGIGPTEKLTVDGNIKASGNLIAGNTSTLYGVDSNIGIGESNPTNANLHVEQADISNSGEHGIIVEAASSELNQTNNMQHIRLVNTNVTNNNFVKIGFGDDLTQLEAGSINGVITDHTNNYGQWRFYLRGATGISEKFIIDPTYILMEGPDYTTSLGTLMIRTQDALAADKGASISLGGVFRTDLQKRDWGKIKGAKTNATHGNENGYLSFSTMTSGTMSEKMRLTDAGIARISGSAAGLVLNPHATALTNEAGLISYHSGNGWFLGRDGTNEFYFAKSSVASFTPGSMLFAGTSGQAQQDNANLFWDDTGNRLHIGGNNPTARLHLPAGTATASTAPLKFTLTGHVPLTTPEAGVLSPNAAFDRLAYTNNSSVRKELAFTDDIPLDKQYATFYEETERQYQFTTSDTITVDTISVAYAADSISVADGLITNERSTTVTWMVHYDFTYTSDEDPCTSFFDLTTDGSENPAAIAGSKARSDQVSVLASQHPGRSFLVNVPAGQAIRLCVAGNIGVSTEMNVSYLTITIQEQ